MRTRAPKPTPGAGSEAFPVSWLDDDFVNRRQFIQALGFVSLAAFGATGALALLRAVRRPSGGPLASTKIEGAEGLAIGASLQFFYPGPADPCILVRTSQDGYAAFSQKCTHLGCPVLYRTRERDLWCPCHRGFFSPEDGRALAGPPRRPLPRVKIEKRGEQWHAIAMAL